MMRFSATGVLKGNAQLPLFREQSLPTSQEHRQANVLAERHHQVVSVDDEEVGLLPLRDSVNGVRGYTVD